MQSLIYLAHNYYDKNEYLNALKYYSKALKLSPSNQLSLFNRAMLLNKLKRTAEEKQAWLIYLDYYPAQILSKDAVRYLNNLGNFDYKIYKLQNNLLILKDSLDLLAKLLSKNQKLKIHIVSYQKNNKKLAKQKAQTIKKYIIKKGSNIDSSRLLLSWFNKSKKVKTINKRYILDESIEFITVIN